MKSYEELLSDIEEDMELMGSSHIVYSMEEDNIVTDYDYLPSDSCTISITLKELQEKLQLQMLYTKVSAHTLPTSRFCTIPAALPANTVTKSALYPMAPSRKMSKEILKK